MIDNPKNEFDMIWKMIHSSIKESGELSDQALDLWFSDVSLRELTEEKAVFAVATQFKYNTLVKRYRDTITNHLNHLITVSADSINHLLALCCV